MGFEPESVNTQPKVFSRTWHGTGDTNVPTVRTDLSATLQGTTGWGAHHLGGLKEPA